MVRHSAGSIGILALQGAVESHRRMLTRIGVDSIPVRSPGDLSRIAGLIVPGGESTTIGLLLSASGLDAAIREHVTQRGLPVFGTCAGLILLARAIKDAPDQARLALLDIVVQRNAFGRQRDSGEDWVEVPSLGPERVRAVFIRAPLVVETGPHVSVLGRWRDRIVLVQEGPILASAFHPELTDDDRLHRYFVSRLARVAV
jgi:5'-phosphate synthase pdxT subunit